MNKNVLIQLNYVCMGIWVLHMNNALMECQARQILPQYNSPILDLIKMYISKGIFLRLKKVKLFIFKKLRGWFCSLKQKPKQLKHSFCLIFTTQRSHKQGYFNETNCSCCRNTWVMHLSKNQYIKLGLDGSVIEHTCQLKCF